MATYWLTYRIADDNTYGQRYAALVNAVDNLCDVWWVEPTSFFLFQSESTIDAVAAAAKRAINARTDVVLVGMPHYKSARVVGSPKVGDALYALLPFAKAA